MKKIKSIKEKVVLHPIMSFLILTFIVIIISGIISAFDITGTYNIVNTKTNSLNSTLITVENLVSLKGLKYIFSNTVSNFALFTPLSMLLITLLGIGIMDKTGFLDTLFYVLTRRLRKNIVTYILTFICILSSIGGDISYIVIIPLAALLFKYGKRNPQAGVINAFAAISCGIGMNFVISSIDSSLLGYTKDAANLIKATDNFSVTSFTVIMIFAIIALSIIITNITEKYIIPRLGKYEFEETEEKKITKKELKALYISLIIGALYLIIFIYNIIPGVPFGGKLLDYTQNLYIDKLFGYNSFFNSGFVFVITMLFFILGLSYGILTNNIKNQRDVCNNFSHSLDNMGNVLVLIFFASTFISILKYSNIGEIFASWISNLITNYNITGLPLILIVFFLSAALTIVLPQPISKWAILSSSVVPSMMSSGMTPEFAQLVFRAGESITYCLTPVMAYFVIYLAYLGLYDQQKEGIGLFKGVKYMIPYSIGTMCMWLVLLILWYLISIPIGINVFPVM